jgi:hypothetical protein
MRTALAWLLAAMALTAASCSSSTSNSTTAPADVPWPPAKRAELSPPAPHVKVQHVLVAFQGSGTTATRSKAEAEKLAHEVYARAVKGEDFAALMKLSDDQPGGTYGLANFNVAVNPGETSRKGMVKGFGDVSFSLNVGEIGACAYDATSSRYGWHIVKRIE